MDTFGFIPDTVELPANLAFRQRRVTRPVDLLGLVVSEETLDVWLSSERWMPAYSA